MRRSSPASGSAEHRRRLVAELAEPGTLAFGIHFADAVFGRVVLDGDGPAWRPLGAADRPAGPGNASAPDL